MKDNIVINLKSNKNIKDNKIFKKFDCYIFSLPKRNKKIKN